MDVTLSQKMDKSDDVMMYAIPIIGGHFHRLLQRMDSCLVNSLCVLLVMVNITRLLMVCFVREQDRIELFRNGMAPFHFRILDPLSLPYPKWDGCVLHYYKNDMQQHPDFFQRWTKMSPVPINGTWKL